LSGAENGTASEPIPGSSQADDIAGAVKLSRDRGESLVERIDHPTRIDGFAHPTFPKLRGPTPKNVGNWVNLTAPVVRHFVGVGVSETIPDTPCY
jgi:hypothetical protein